MGTEAGETVDGYRVGAGLMRGRTQCLLLT
jgi:hypothetical protein